MISPLDSSNFSPRPGQTQNSKPETENQDSAPLSRRAFVKTTLAGAVAAPMLGQTSAGGATMPAVTAVESLVVPLDRAAGPLSVEGPHRFRTVAGRTGLHVTSLKTKATLTTALPRAARGTLSLWFSPLEDLTFSRGNESTSKVPFEFPLVSDVYPGHELQKARCGLFVRGGYPALLAKFASGGIFARLDHGLAPFVYAEKVLLRPGYWYHVAVTWDRSGKKMVIYLNGMMAGHNERADGFEDAGPVLHVGNPMMVLRDFRLEARALDDREVAARYAKDRSARNALPDADLRALLVPAFGPALDLRRDASWRTAYECSFTREAETKAWLQQGPGEKYRQELRMETTAEGLYLKTPDPIAVESRMYLWSPQPFDGDQWIECEFRVESPAGLALLVVCASGMQREDFFADHGIPATGSMATILRDVRCYHWEFVRRVEAMRTDVETQYLAKNPFGRRLHAGCVPRLEQNRWYRLRFIKAGARLHGSFDGRTVFDVTDTALENNGPVYNFGRIGLRHMYHTALRYRNLVVYQREPAAVT